jgi:pyridoxal phosphate enzyme (YggS family)
MSYKHVSDQLNKVKASLPENVTLVVVSKTHPPEAIKICYDLGHRTFGENRVQELIEKQQQLPSDIEWHLIGHLQTNKVKYIIEFVALIHSVDSLKLLSEIDKRARSSQRVVDVLLQVHIAEEETKFGFDGDELYQLLSGTAFDGMKNVNVRGLMGMATFTGNTSQVRREFNQLTQLFNRIQQTYFTEQSDFNVLSMGMSGDYGIAIEEGSTMVRIGSTIFGHRL